jgi:hypothetical protein
LNAVKPSERLQGRKLARKAGDDQLIDVFRLVEILQALLAEVAETDVGRGVVEHELPRCRREQDLATVAGGHDARCAVDAEPDVVGLGERGLARMQSHPHPENGPLRPRVLGKRTLAVGGGGDRVLGPSEDDEEGVALSADLVSPVLGKRSPQQTPVLGKDVLIALAQDPEQPGRAFDVSEEEGDGSAWKIGHQPRRGLRVAAVLSMSRAACGVANSIRAPVETLELHDL